MNFNFFKPQEGLSRDKRVEVVSDVLKSETERLQMDEFADVFKKEDMDNDKKLVDRLKHEFDANLDHFSDEERKRIKEIKNKSEALEVIVGDQVELNDWFGPNAYLTRTTEYDDMVNGIDAFVEFNLEDRTGEIALAIDASMRPDFSSVERKIKRNISKINGEKPLRIKYFKSQINDYKGKKYNVIPVVIGVEGNNLDELLTLFAQVIKIRKNKEKTESGKNVLKEKMEEMRIHPAQIVFLKEIKMQLDMYSKINIKEPMQKKVAEISAIINGIIQDKENEKIGLGNLKDDAVFDKIKDVVRSCMPK